MKILWGIFEGVGFRKRYGHGGFEGLWESVEIGSWGFLEVCGVWGGLELLGRCGEVV